MGRSTDLGHVFMDIFKDDRFEENLVEAIGTDEDVNGNNGEEYTKEEALNEGFKSTAEWIAHNSIKQFGKTDQAIRKAFEEIFENDDYYQNYDLIIVDDSDYFTVSVAYIYGC